MVGRMADVLRLVSWNIENLAPWLEDAARMAEQHAADRARGECTG